MSYQIYFILLHRETNKTNVIMNTDISKSLIIVTLIVVAIIVFSLCNLNLLGSDLLKCVLIGVIILLLLPIAWIPIKVTETSDYITIKKVVGRKIFAKKDYTIEKVDYLSSTTIRLFASNVWVYWGIFWSKNIGRYYGIHIQMTNLLLLTNKMTGSKVLIDTPR